MRVKTLSSLIRRVITDPGFRDKLFKDPGEIVASYGLDRIDEVLLNALKPGKLETIIGGMLSHKLLPHRVSRSFIVLPFSAQPAVDEDIIPIWIDQWNTGVEIGKDGKPKRRGRAFGSGGHPSTSLCLHALEDTFSGAPQVLDIGTGSGILAIAVAKLGASHVLAIDIDEGAVQIARANIKKNEVDHIVTVEQGTIHQLECTNYDLILANILSSVHLNLLREGMLDLLTPGGNLILSGIHDHERELLQDGVKSAGGIIIDGYKDQGWISLVVRHQVDD